MLVLVLVVALSWYSTEQMEQKWRTRERRRCEPRHHHHQRSGKATVPITMVEDGCHGAGPACRAPVLTGGFRVALDTVELGPI